MNIEYRILNIQYWIFEWGPLPSPLSPLPQTPLLHLPTCYPPRYRTVTPTPNKNPCTLANCIGYNAL